MGDQVTVLKRTQESFYASFLTYLTRLFQALASQPAAGSKASLAALDAACQILPRYGQLLQTMQVAGPKAFSDALKAFLLSLQALLRRDLRAIGEHVIRAQLRMVDHEDHLFPEPTASTMPALAANAPSLFPVSTSIAKKEETMVDTFPALDTVSYAGLLGPVGAIGVVVVGYARSMLQIHAVLAEIVPDGAKLRRLVGPLLETLTVDVEELVRAFVDCIHRGDRGGRHAVEAWLGLLAVARQVPEGPVRRSLERVVAVGKQWSERFVDVQMEGLREQRFMSHKRVGLFAYIIALPKFVRHFERLCRADPLGSKVAHPLLQQTYRRVGETALQLLERLPRDATDDKELMNAAVMGVENGHYLESQLEALGTLPWSDGT